MPRWRGRRRRQGLREAGFDGRIVLIGEEPAPPYARPELSKGYLLGGKAMADVLVHPAGFYAEHDIEVRTATTVTGIDRATSQVRISGGESLAYDRLLLTTGAAPRRLDVPVPTCRVWFRCARWGTPTSCGSGSRRRVGLWWWGRGGSVVR